MTRLLRSHASRVDLAQEALPEICALSDEVRRAPVGTLEMPVVGCIRSRDPDAAAVGT